MTRNVALGRSRIEQFVRDLYRYVMNQDVVPDEWIEGWVERGLRLNDPIALFEAFVSSKGVQGQRAGAAEARTHWPHGHFYSPVVNKREVEQEWPRLSRRQHVPAVELRLEAQQDLFIRFARSFRTMPFNDLKTPPYRYYYKNPSYTVGDACIYWGMLNEMRPRRIIEIGSGYTSALALDAIDFLELPTKCTFIDPYPDRVRETTTPLAPQHEILPIKVQQLDIRIVDDLGVNDLLFIDSSHIVKTGSDVQFEITELLPRIRSGVLVHFHDIFYPFEYNTTWVLEKNYSWNETYFLNAFLMYNEAFQIEFFNHFFVRNQPDLVHLHAGQKADALLRNPGGGLWLRRV